MSFIGNTPMVEIAYKYRGVPGSVFAKLEYYNPSGSIKDRVAEYIVSTAEARGELKPGQPIVEVTSGNTGISFSAVGARKGYPVHIFMPSWVSPERKKIMRMYGAYVYEVTREDGGFDAAFVKADELAKQIGAYMPKQFDNPDNAEAHRLGTGREILTQLPDVTDFVSGIGTGGTLMGIGRALKEGKPGLVKIHALEPDALPLLRNPNASGEHKIEGIGDDFMPSIVDPAAIDSVIDINDDDAVIMAARLASELGLGVGISSGANFLAAAVINSRPGHHVTATVFADDSKKYLTTSLSNPPRAADNMISANIELTDIMEH